MVADAGVRRQMRDRARIRAMLPLTDPLKQRLNVMQRIVALCLVSAAAFAQQLPHDDAVRIAEFYRLANRIQDEIWPGWSTVPAPLLLITKDAEFLTHHPEAPTDFRRLSADTYTRSRHFNTDLLATFPAFGPPPVIVIGEPQNTEAMKSTPWLITLLHEHFHQLQNAQPGYYDAVAKLNLSDGDNTGMWMLNYPFPYDKPEVAQAFANLRDLLLKVLAISDEKEFKRSAMDYVAERKRVFAQLSPNDHKYLSFQLWQEGIARYTQVKAAEAAAVYQPTDQFKALPDYESFSEYAARARNDTLSELRRADLAKMKRTFVYSFGGAEGFLLDRLNPAWKQEYLRHPLSTDFLFDLARN